MSEPLSIFDAALDAGERPGIRTGERTLSFAELASLVRERISTIERRLGDRTPYPVVGSNTLEAAITVYALLELRVPALLVHPRLTAPERESVLAHAARLGLVPSTDTAAVLHTSGTTGAPRAALLGRGAFVASAQASAANLGWLDDDCWLLCMPLAHVGGLSILTRCLAARRCLALAPHFEARNFPGLVQESRASIVSLVPTMLSQVLDAHPSWTPSPPLRAILLGGAAASARLLERAAERALPVLVSYGMTETCSQVTTTPYASRFDAARRGTGQPLPGIDVRVEAGHIEVRGPVLMSGYWGERPLLSGAWFATGDLGELDAAGDLHVYARRQDLIVTGGENVYPAEVEHVLERMPGVRAAGVFGVPDDTWGQIVAAAIVADSTAVAPEAVARYVARRLAPHKRPRRLCFVGQLPQTRAGKLDRAALSRFVEALDALPAAGDA